VPGRLTAAARPPRGRRAEDLSIAVLRAIERPTAALPLPSATDSKSGH
jgi:hypothetical protein